MAYNEEDFLNLAGIQHFAFCRRQWALIHIEQQWKENVRTIEGSIFHENAHNGNIKSTRRGSIVSRGIAVFSRELGVNGICDVVEFVPDRNGVSIEGANGKYIPIPIEYKKGYTPKVKISKKCRACSLSEICIPKLCKNSSVKEYINRRIEEI